VLGAAIGVVLPSKGTDDGMIAFIVAGVITGAVAILAFLRLRAVQMADQARRQAPSRQSPPPPHAGPVEPRTAE
jgi:hypothetical protein